MTHIVNRSCNQFQIFSFTQLNHVQRRVMNVVSRLSKTILCRDIIKRNHVVCFQAAGEQHPGFFETFANRRNPVSQPTARNLQQATGLRVIKSVTKCFKFICAVSGVNAPTRKHIHSAGERGAVSALQHKNFNAIGYIANQHHGCGWSQGALVFARTLLFCTKTCHAPRIDTT